MMRAFRYSRFCGAAMALLVAGCSKSDGYSQQQRLCIAQKFPGYDSTKMDECVAACKACLNGNTITCTTSCTLKGAK